MAKNSLNKVLKKALEFYNRDQFKQTAQDLSRRELLVIKKELKDIAANKKYNLIKLTKILKPLILPTAKRIVLDTQIKLSELDLNKNIVIYMPNHKSHLDEFMIGYTLLVENLPIPITAAGENLFKTKASSFVMKSYGAFKIRRDKYTTDEHYYRLLSSYLGASLMLGDQLMTFQEGTRPRDGKVGLFRKGIIGTVESFFNDIKNNPENIIEDILFIPIAINWSENPDEKKITGDISAKAEDTDLITRFLNIKRTHSSRDIRGVYLGFGEPISYNQFVSNHDPDEDGNYAIPIVNEVRARVLKMMPIFKEHLLYSSVQFLSKINKRVKVSDFIQLFEVTQNVIGSYKDSIKIIETDGFNVNDRLDLMAYRDIIKFSDDKSSFEVIHPRLVDYYANHVTSLTEELGIDA